MSDGIKKEDDVKSDINSDDQGHNTSNEVNLPSEGEKTVNHEVIHKKDGRLHIYVRQDKYKGELKSKNWVGRAYIAGKQTIHSSRTTVLEEAIPILEKWFDEISEKKDEAQNKTENLEKNPSESISKTEIQEKQLPLEKDENKGLKSGMFEKLKDIKVGNLLKSKKSSDENSDENKNSPSSMMDKLKNIKLDGLLKKNTNEGAEGEKKSFDSIKKLFKPGGDNKGKKSSLDSIKNLFKSKVSIIRLFIF